MCDHTDARGRRCARPPEWMIQDSCWEHVLPLYSCDRHVAPCLRRMAELPGQYPTVRPHTHVPTL
jgi:hypothetical protein